MVAFVKKSPNSLIQLLLQSGANPHLSDDVGRTALSWAVKERNVWAIKCLIAENVDLEISTVDPWERKHVFQFVFEICHTTLKKGYSEVLSRCLDYLRIMKVVAKAGTNHEGNSSTMKLTQTQLVEDLNWFISKSVAITKSPFVQWTHEMGEDLQEIGAIVHVLTDMMSNPLSLKHLCRIQIRGPLVGRDFRKKLQQLNVPLQLQEYLRVYEESDLRLWFFLGIRWFYYCWYYIYIMYIIYPQVTIYPIYLFIGLSTRFVSTIRVSLCFFVQCNIKITSRQNYEKEHSNCDTLQWRHNGHDDVSNHQPHDCLLNRLFRRRSKETSKLRVKGLCAWNSPVSGEFPAQRASNAENVSISWRHHSILRVVWLNTATIGIRAMDFIPYTSWLIAPIYEIATNSGLTSRNPYIVHISLKIKPPFTLSWQHLTHLPVTRKIFPFDDVIMSYICSPTITHVASQRPEKIYDAIYNTIFLRE